MNLTTRILLAAIVALIPQSAIAQLSETGSTVVFRNGTEYSIEGGAQTGSSLLHQFSKFNLNQNETATFQLVADNPISRIVVEVLGETASFINGALVVPKLSDADTNLIFVNPLGIVFGSGASLNIPGSFTATTANRIAIGSQMDFLFESRNVGVIVNEANLAVRPGQDIVLIGGTVVSTGTLTAPGGNVVIAAVNGNQRVSVISQPPSGNPGKNLLSLVVAPGSIVDLASNPASLAELLTGGDPIPELRTLRASNEGVTLASTGATIQPQDVVIQRLSAGSVNAVAQNDLRILENLSLFTSGSPPQLAIAESRVILFATNTIDTRAISASGGTINLGLHPSSTQPTNSISTGSLDTSSSAGITNGGISVNANRSLSILGSVNTSSTSSTGDAGNAGSINLNSLGDLLVGAISADSQAAGLAGNGGSVLINGLKIVTERISTQSLGRLSSRGGAVRLNAEISNPESSIVTGNILTNTTSQQSIPPLRNVDAGNVEIRSGAKIQTGDIQAVSKSPDSGESARGTGGMVTLNSRYSDIQTGSIVTTGQRTGGNIAIEALEQGKIETGQLSSQAVVGNSGGITLRSGSSTQVNTINARGGIDGIGGEIDISTGEFFRAIGSFTIDSKQPVSLATTANSIKIQHIGGFTGTPFTVGEAESGAVNRFGLPIFSALTNGTVGTISTGDQFLIPQEYPYEHLQTTPFSTIHLITAAAPPPKQPPIETPPIKTPPIETPPIVELPEPTIPPVESTPTPSEPRVTPTDSEISPETDLSETFQDFFGQGLPRANPTVNDAQEVARRIQQEAGIKPAFVYLNFSPNWVEENGKLVHRRDRDALEILLITSSGEKIRRVRYDIDRAAVMAAAQKFRSRVTNRRSRDYLAPAQELYQMLIAPLEKELQEQQISNLLFLVDSGLRSLPFAALHDGNQFLIEKYSLGIAPSLGLVDTRYVPIQKAPLLAMGASKFTDNLPLPAVPIELEQITQTRSGQSFLNQEFTLANLVKARSTGGILHLATHGEFKPGAANQSFIQLWNAKLTLDQMRFLGAENTPDLLVLSACRTALGDEQAELGFAGLATQAGVKSALASLWYISDAGALAMMTEFYHHLSNVNVTTKAEALRRSQLAMLRGQVAIEDGILRLPSRSNGIALPEEIAEARSMSHPYYWAPFTMIGNPW